jgi:hypothetical protein
MPRKIISTILALCLLMLFAMKYTQPTIAFENPLLEVNVTGYYLTAGVENEMSISITNIGKKNAYDVKAALSVPSTVSGISIVKESYVVLEYIYCSTDTTRWMHPVLYVESSCPLGAYSLTLELEYTDASDTMYVDSVQIGVVVNAVKPANPLLAINATGCYLAAGVENGMSISIENIGKTDAFDVKAALSVPSTVSGISIVKESYTTFDVIHHEEIVWMHPVLYVESSCPLGAYSLTLELEYTDASDTMYTDSMQIGVAVDSVEPTERTRIAIQDFKITPTEVFVGDELTVEMEIKNWGANAYDIQVQVVIDSQSPFVSLDPTLVFVGDLRSNQAAKVIYDLRISGDADATLYVLQLVISYYDVDDQPASLTEAISIDVHSIVDFRLLDIQPSILTAEPGETMTIEADLLLLGTETVDFVEVEIVENPSIGPFLTIPESYEYIGRVDPDSPVLFTIQFMVDSNATSGRHTLQVRVSCWDGYNQQRQTMIELPVIVNETSGNSENTSVSLWDIIWTVIRILLGVKP